MRDPAGHPSAVFKHPSWALWRRTLSMGRAGWERSGWWGGRVTGRSQPCVGRLERGTSPEPRFPSESSSGHLWGAPGRARGTHGPAEPQPVPPQPSAQAGPTGGASLGHGQREGSVRAASMQCADSMQAACRQRADSMQTACRQCAGSMWAVSMQHVGSIHAASMQRAGSVRAALRSPPAWRAGRWMGS